MTSGLARYGMKVKLHVNGKRQLKLSPAPADHPLEYPIESYPQPY